MTNQSTMDKLIEMRLTTMADAFRNQLNDPKFKEVPFEDQFGMLVDIEYSSRKNNRLKRLIKNAGFDQPEANIMDINYTSVSIPIKTSTFFGNSEHSFPEKQSIPFRNRVQFIF